MSDQGGVGASDDAFISFMFAIVSVVGLVVYLPFISRVTLRVVNFLNSKIFGKERKQRNVEEDNPFLEFYESFMYIPRLIMMFAAQPSLLSSGWKACFVDRAFTMKVCLPQVLKFCLRPKIIILWMWIFLFSSALYTTLTFDAHLVLGIPTTASAKEVTKAYRSLVRVNHPDHNKTEAAKALFPQIKKAYKALTDRDAFDEEMRKEEISFGVGLPTFLTKKGNETIVLFSLLGMLFGVPLLIWYKWGRSQNKVQNAVDRINPAKERIGSFLQALGFPEDPKVQEKSASRRRILTILSGAGLLPAGATERTVENFPPIGEFASRCKNAEKFVVSLTNMGFDEVGIERLKSFCVENGDTLVEEYTKEVQQIQDGTFKPVPKSDYATIRYLLSHHVEEVDSAVDELNANVPAPLRSAKKIQQIHAELFDFLVLVYEREKPLQRHIQAIIEIPQRIAAEVDEILPEVQRLINKSYKRWMEENGYAMNKKKR